MKKTEIAIVGMACRFPGAGHYREFWRNLDAGVDSVCEIPASRWDNDRFYSPRVGETNRTVSKWCGLLEHIDRFDNRFFRISPREAKSMDPQQRLLLEETWHCLEDAGVAPRLLREQQTGVYVGSMSADYLQEAAAPGQVVDSYAALGSYECILANRISHFLGLAGPSFSINAACASSLVALHLARLALLSGECAFAIAAGVNLNSHPFKYLSFSRARMLSPTGRCRTFDKDADGYVPGEGAGVLLLQRLDDALATGRHIHGILAGSAVNHVGAARSITAPRMEAQRDVVLAAYDGAGFGPPSVTYVEAHGTGTSLGDPIEVEALTRAFRQSTNASGFCHIGSVKTNIGHLEAAAGIAGVIKVLLMIRHRRIPATLHVRKLNPIINFADSPFVPALAAAGWQTDGTPLRAGVSSFGFGGVNSHVLLQEPPPPPASADKGGLFLLSAKTPGALSAMVADWQAFARTDEFAAAPLADLLDTLKTGREHLPCRFAEFVPDKSSLGEMLDRQAQATPFSIAARTQPWRLHFDPCRLLGFPKYPIGAWLEDCLARLCGEQARDLALEPAALRRRRWKQSERPLFRFIVALALAESYRRLGFRPALITGTGAGRWVALAAAGMLQLGEVGRLLRNEQPEPPRLARPHTAFSDGLKLWRPFAIGPTYLRNLRRCLALDEAGLAHLLATTRDLTHSQFTFKKYLEEWADLLRKVALDLTAMIAREGEAERANESERLLLAAVLGNCVLRLHRKWDLSPALQGGNDFCRELDRLLLDEVMPHELLIGFLLNDDADLNAMAQVLDDRQERLSDAALFPLLRECAEPLEQPDRIWFSDKGSKGLFPSTRDLPCLHIGAADGEGGQVAIDHLPGEAAYLRSLGRLWCQGLPLTLERLPPLGGHTLPLPLYPFEGRSFWLPRPQPAVPLATTAADEPEPGTAPGHPGYFLYEPVWQPADRDPVAAPVVALLHIDLDGTVPRRPPQGFRGKCWTVGAGAAFCRDGNAFRICRARPEDFRRLLESLGEEQDLSAGLLVVFEARSQEADEFQFTALRDLFHLCQALAAGRLAADLVVVTRQAFPLLPEDGGGVPAQACLAGFLASLRLEHPRIRAALVDTDRDLPAAILVTAAGASPLTAFRAGRRFERRMVALPRLPVRNECFRSDRTYLFTGGAGGLALQVAATIAARFGGRFALLGRSTVNDCIEERLERLREAGAQARYFQADVSCETELAGALADIHKHFGPIHGVFHAAGLLEDRLLTAKDWASCLRVLAPKTKGTALLDRMTRAEPLDWFVACASIVGLLGNPGQADYGAANAYLDAYCRQRAASGAPGRSLSLDWTLWCEGGMGQNDATRAGFAAKAGLLDTSAGTAAFFAALDARAPQVAVTGHEAAFAAAPGFDEIASLETRLLALLAETLAVSSENLDAHTELTEFGMDPVSLIRFQDKIASRFDIAEVQLRDLPTVARLAEHLAGHPGGEALGTRTVAGPADPSASESYAATLVRLLCAVLHLGPNELELDSDLRDFGLDSVSLTELSERIVAETGVEFNAALLFQYPTARQIATYLARHAPAPPPPATAPPSQRTAAPPPRRLETKLVAAARLVDPAGVAWMPVEASPVEAIAIVGMSGRFPGSPDLAAFWENLAAGRDLVSEIPADRWDWRAIYGDPKGERNLSPCKWGGFLDDVRRFDAAFFTIPPSLAARMDPQQRILMEEVWHALEDACIPPSSLAGSQTGMFIGVSNDDYSELMIQRGLRLDAHTTTGTYLSMIPNRISYFLDIHGPSIAVNTACSSSLVAVHQAMRAILAGDCETAIAGGVNICLTPRLFFSLSHGGMLSPQGRCKTFDQTADGYVRGEGAAVVVLKSLAAARAAGNRILGVLRAGAVNHGGFANSLTAPNPNAQAALVVKAWQRAGLDPATAGYIEAHGTGTSLGDPIEVNALKLAFEELYEANGLDRPMRPHIALGSVKANIGHLESAAGIAGLVKILLAMRHRRLPANIHLKTLNPLVDLAGSPFHVPRESLDWEPARPGLPLRAGVSSFGFGGANAHLVVEEYPQPDHAVGDEQQLLVLSARDENRLREMAGNLQTWLRSHPAVPLERVAASLQLGREAMSWRLALVAGDLATLVAGLEDFLQGRPGAYHQGRRQAQTEELFEGRAGEAFWDVVMGERDLVRIGRLWVAGAEVDWRRLYPVGPPPLLGLPGYPFAKDPHWLPEVPAAAPSRQVGLHPLIDLNRSTLERHGYAKWLNASAPCLADHRLAGQPVLPGAAYLEMARAAVALATEQEVTELRNLVWLRPFAAGSAEAELRIELHPRPGAIEVTVLSGAEGEEPLIHARGEVISGQTQGPMGEIHETALRSRCDQNMSAEACYRLFAENGLDYGPAFRAIRDLAFNENEALARVARQQPGELDACFLHPALLDGAFQSLIVLLGDQRATWLPFSVEALQLRAPLPAEILVHARRAGSSSASVPTFDLTLAEAGGRICATVRGFSLRAASGPGTAVAPPVAQQRMANPVAPTGGTSSPRFPRLCPDLVGLVATLLGLPAEAIEPAAEMSDFGFDSITLTELAHRINEAFDLELTPALLFDHLTLAALAQYLEEKFPARLGAHYGDLRMAAPPASEPVAASLAWQRVQPDPVRARDAAEPIAIVGMSAVLPGSPDIRAFWEHLAASRDLIGEVPPDRWDWRAIHGDPREEGNRTNIRWGGFMDRVDTFDAAFFGISDLEALLMDPQQRIFMETAWKAVEDAGYPPPRLSGSRTGLFVGVSTSDYLERLRELPIEAHTATGWAHTMLPNRISYQWNLRGPSEPVDTACSSSLVALHRAVASIRAGECDQAIAGGVNVLASPLLYISFSKAGMLCEDGRCKVFDKRANGYVRGEGAGALFLKPLDRALADGDPIHGLILGSAVNHGGHANSLTAPNAPAQAEVIEAAILQAGIDPATIGYIEAHGTGTALGDPIEINGLKQAFEALYRRRGETPPRSPHCLIGSVKSNIGHLEAAAGIAGVIKVLLAMKHRSIPANLNLEEVNPYIELAGSPFSLATTASPWPASAGADPSTLRAGVSSFGFGGVNAHLVLASPPPTAPLTNPAARPRAFVLSARDRPRLQAYARRMLAFVAAERFDPEAFVHTLQVGREAMAARLAFVFHDREELLARLQDFLAGNEARIFTGNVTRTPLEPDSAEGGADPAAACRAWVAGALVDWRALRPLGNPPRRLSLPGYPFAPERHWPPGSPEPAAAQPAEANHQRCCYRPGWVELPAPKPVPIKGTLVLLDDDGSRLDEMSRAFSGQGASPILVSPGTGFLQRSSGRFELNFQDEEHCRALFRHVGNDLSLVDCRWLTPRPDGAPPDRELREYATLLRDLLQVHPGARLRAVCAVAMEHGQAPPPRAALGALLHVLVNEHARFSFALVETDCPRPPWHQLRAELGHPGFRHVRLAGGQRWERRILPVTESEAAAPSPLVTGGVYLITGGAGGLGRIVAEFLAREHRARLVLTGRSPLTGASLDPLFRSIRQAGGDACYLQANVSDAAAMSAAVAEAHRRFGPLDGVFHAAGLIRDNLFINKTAADFEAVLAPKVHGLAILDQVTRQEPLSLFVTFSSVAAPIGNPGQADYAAANSFMDFYAEQSGIREDGRICRRLSLNWPLWRDGGMHVDADFLAPFSRRTGLVPLPTAEGLAALHAALRTAHPVLMPLYGDRSAIERTLGVVAAPGPSPAIEDAITVSPAGAGQSDERLRARTLDYLVEQVAAALKTTSSRVVPGEPFREYGVDSFLVLKIINRLEKDFGNLPKTLLFEHADLEALTDYFLANHEPALAARFPPPASGRVPAMPVARPEPSPELRLPAGETVMLPWSELADRPEYQELAQSLLARFGTEASVSRGTRDIAPDHFFGSAKSAYFNTCRNHRTLLVYAFTGPEEAFETLAAELLAWCAAHGLEPNFIGERRLQHVAGTTFTATPFGACQRLEDLAAFNLEGTRMRRLRYLVARFRKAGACRVEEYRPGSDATIDHAIADLIDVWSAGKTQVNPLILRVRSDILAGRLGGMHRLFLTYLDERLQNAVLITHLPARNGYLMDLEFYGAGMPLGGLEFAISEILARLRDEGCTFYSLGGTYGPEVAPSPNADPGIARIFAAMRERDDFGQGNYQFKNKFRPRNDVLYLCRPAGGDPETVADILLMIAAPEIAESPSPSPAPPIAVASDERRQRAQALAACGYNPMHLEQVAYDLKTDSWAQLSLPAIAARLEALAGTPVSATPTALLTGMLPFAHFSLFQSGRAAESGFCRNLRARGRHVLQNLLFPTAIFNQIDNDFIPVEMPDPAVFTAHAENLFRGNLDLQALAAFLTDRAYEVAFVWIELGNNAAGGYPVSLDHLREVRRLLAPHGIPLVLDATRILENARFILDQEPDHGDLWAVAAALCRQADHLTASLAKDFCFDGGGLVATNDGDLHARIQADNREPEGLLEPAGKALLAAALSDRAFIEVSVRQRMAAVARLHAALTAAGLPLLQPAGGHGVFLDTARLPQLAGFAWPLHSLLAWLYEHTGVRAGIHNAGMRKGTLLNGLVRFAVPVGLTERDLAELTARLCALWAEAPPLRDLVLEERPPGIGGEALARFTPGPHAFKPAPASAPVAGQLRSTGACDIAIVGISGRYPGAPDLDTFWQNLAAGVDSIEVAPRDRFATRASETHWGGWLTDVDKFDARFFNISPREAECMDPQERLFLETAWAALEDAGYTPESLVPAGEARNVGVYVGAVWSFYQVLGTEEVLRGNIQAPNSFHWSIANRVSYAMNLTGPSLTLDTACSSSLTAVHLACEALRAGTCRAAIAGGVNLDLHPGKRLITAAGGTLSPDGRCFAFGSRANGYVAGEGVGALLLKPLGQAEADGDHIYGVIRSTAVNHGGRTSGFVVPNPAAQAGLIEEALAAAGINARTVTYVEAHGTGTKLGDPVEIEGLTRAFRLHGDERQFCALGSVKTNIGHLEAAAGVAGITKLLLQLRERKLVPSLHAEPANELIDFAASPFFVQQALTDWRPAIRDGREQPLRAGLSSFGAGGTNVHLLVEEYRSSRARREVAAGAPELVVLSARGHERLIAYAARLRAAVARRPDADLRDLAFTLRQGRRVLDHRLALVVASVEGLLEALAAFEQGRPADNLITGKANRAPSGRKDRDADLGGSLIALARAWVTGEVDLPAENRNDARRVPLPSYPFERRRHWIETIAPALHPLIDSRDGEMAFVKRFDPDQFVFRDHLVAGVPTLPGVGYLEMVRAAALQAGAGPIARLKNHVWASPIDPACDPLIRILLTRKKDHLAYEVVTDEPGTGRLVHAQGRLIEGGPGAAEPALDLAAIERRCGHLVDREETYRRLEASGLTYGDELKSIRWSRLNQGEQLTRLELPASLLAERDRFLLHPAIMDGAVQAVVGLLDGDEGAFLPFVLGELVIHQPLTPVCYAHIRRADSGGTIKKFQIAITDEDGRLLVRMSDFALKAREDKDDASPPWFYERYWRAAPEASSGPPPSGTLLVFAAGDKVPPLTASPFAAQRTLTVVAGTGFAQKSERRYEIDPARAEDHAALITALARRDLLPSHVLFICPEGAEDHTEIALEWGLWPVFHLLRALLETAPRAKLRLLFAWRERVVDSNPAYAAVAALLRTAGLEHPAFSGSSFCLRGPWDSASLWRELAREGHEEVLIDGAERKLAAVRALRLTASQRQPAAKAGGVYLITGGAGGLGLLFARHLAATAGAVVLAGRSPETPALARRLEALGAGKARIAYLRSDVGTRQDAIELVARVRTQFGRIDGVLHAAGVLRDALLRNKSASDMAAVLAPKVLGTLFLDEATRDDHLDFFVLFSSLASVTGNPGQSDYASANRFMDAFARRREALRAQGLRQGRTLAINWPLWREGGMGVDEATERLLARTTGMTPLATEQGLAALELGLGFAGAQLIVADGDRARLDRTLGLAPVSAPPPDSRPRPAPSRGGQRILTTLAAGLTKILKVPAAEVDPEADLAGYGFDSLTFTDFTNYINDSFELDLTPVVFYEVDTLAALAAHLAELGGDPDPVGAEVPPAVEVADRIVPATAVQKPVPSADGDEPFAIVGMSAVMPGSPDLATFWRHLLKGDDLIGEIPPDRWDWRAIYGDPLTEADKTDIKWGGFMPEIDKFDAAFFGISPREAVLMDPQQRIFLETVWKTIEDAGYGPGQLAGSRTGLFVGSGGIDYHDLLIRNGVEIGAHSATGMMHSVLANRVSYLLNLRGPSEPVETACSSSLVALHRAMAAIQQCDCEQAIVGGINLITSPDLYIGLAKASMLSPDGRCKTFDKAADGYVRGEGIGAILIKPLSRALAGGDSIYALIRGSAVNHGGRANSLTSPNLNAQVEVLEEAYRRAGIDPTSVGFIEAHGTGTALGDPIEINALKKAFRALYDNWQLPQPKAPHCLIGSVKTNIGHLELASGLAGLLKVVLALVNRTIPANLHLQQPNPYIRLEGSPFALASRRAAWPAPAGADGSPQPRRAGVSSFGFGGVNAHVVLEEYLQPEATAHGNRGPWLFLLSARDEERLGAYAASLAEWLDGIAAPDGEATLPGAAVVEGLCALLADCLHVPVAAIDPAESAADLGLDGAAAAILTERINTRFQSDLTPAALARFASIHALARHLGRTGGAAAVPADLLANIAYTSQIGRDPMSARLAIAAGDLAALRAGLACRPDEPRTGVYRGLVAKRAAPNETALTQALADHDLDRLARWWVAGQPIDWQLLYDRDPQHRPRRISLPGYPFARTRYWFKAEEMPSPAVPARQPEHPMLRHALRTPAGFEAVLNLDPDAFYLADHRVAGRAMLPGAACLELARAAGIAAGLGPAGYLREINWSRPLTAGAETRIGISRGPEPGHFHIGGPERAAVSGQWSAEVPPTPESLAVDSLRERLRPVPDLAAFYAAFEERQIHYGPSFRALEALWSSEHEALALIRLPAHLQADSAAFGLHPSLVDAAFQAVALLAADAPAGRTFVPFSLAECDIHAHLPTTCYAHIRQTGGEIASRRFQITLAGTTGRVCVTLRDFTLRAILRPEPPRRIALDHPLLDSYERLPLHPLLDSYVPVANPSSAKGTTKMKKRI